jgi:serine/threonine-protein kinase SRPK3
VFRCVDELRSIVALKVVKSANHYTEAAEDEIKLLQKVVEKSARAGIADPPIVMLLDHFYVRGPHGKHVCMVFEVLGANLLSLIKKFDHKGMPVLLVKRIMRQVLEGMRLLHDDCGIIHTDLKPENVLLGLSGRDLLNMRSNLSEASLSTEARTGSISHSVEAMEAMSLSRLSHNRSRTRSFSLDELLDSADLKVKIADLGNACWIDRHFTSDIQTRQYRAPEVILGIPYGPSADIWSVACMTFELVTGDLLFVPRKGRQYDKNEDHVAQMIELLGRLPRRMIKQGRYSDEIFNKHGELKHIRNLDYWPLIDVLREKYECSTEEASLCSSFLLPMLDYNPQTRATAAECLAHPWLSESLAEPESS